MPRNKWEGRVVEMTFVEDVYRSDGVHERTRQWTSTEYWTLDGRFINGGLTVQKGPQLDWHISDLRSNACAHCGCNYFIEKGHKCEAGVIEGKPAPADPPPEPEIKSSQVDKAAGLIGEAVLTDGVHHKQWYLEQIAEALDISLTLGHDPGISP